jgi:hypothetical protein
MDRDGREEERDGRVLNAGAMVGAAIVCVCVCVVCVVEVGEEGVDKGSRLPPDKRRTEEANGKSSLQDPMVRRMLM